jgi:hypothetical protein
VVYAHEWMVYEEAKKGGIGGDPQVYTSAAEVVVVGG